MSMWTRRFTIMFYQSDLIRRKITIVTLPSTLAKEKAPFALGLELRFAIESPENIYSLFVVVRYFTMGEIREAIIKKKSKCKLFPNWP